jgi:hypothetical protein
LTTPPPQPITSLARTFSPEYIRLGGQAAATGPTTGATLRRLAREVTNSARFALLHGASVDDEPDLLCAAVGSYASGLTYPLAGVTQ